MAKSTVQMDASWRAFLRAAAAGLSMWVLGRAHVWAWRALKGRGKRVARDHGAPLKIPAGEDADLSRLGLTTIDRAAVRALRERKDLRSLNLGENQLRELPADFGTDFGPLARLNLSGNSLTGLPHSLGKMTHLKMLGLKGNKLRRLPDGICNLKDMRALFLTSNELALLPKGIEQLTSLRKLQASRNRFRELPDDELARLPSLELLRAAACDLERVPHGLCRSPTLCWLAFAGNPCFMPGNAAALRDQVKALQRPLGDVVLEDATLSDEEYGGASAGADGVVACRLKGKEDALVLKWLQAASVSPDGDAEDELLATVAIRGASTALPRLVALVEDATKPVRRIGLLLERAWGEPLAKKPRDTVRMLRCRWDGAELRFSFSAAFAAQCVYDVARALAAMHERRIAHGDVYAHNLLVQRDGSATLIDFGAAFFYPEGFGAEKLEVRAFGLFVEDLVEHTLRVRDAGETRRDGRALTELRDLAGTCMSREVSRRPAFAECVFRCEEILGGLRSG